MDEYKLCILSRNGIAEKLFSQFDFQLVSKKHFVFHTVLHKSNKIIRSQKAIYSADSQTTDSNKQIVNLSSAIITFLLSLEQLGIDRKKLIQLQREWEAK